MDSKTETNKFTLRLPKDLDAALEKQAKSERRSKNNYIEIMLEQDLAAKNALNFQAAQANTNN